MAENNKIYITANELAEMLGVSVGHVYKLIRKLNQELEKEGFLVIEERQRERGSQQHCREPLGLLVIGFFGVG